MSDFEAHQQLKHPVSHEGFTRLSYLNRLYSAVYSCHRFDFESKHQPKSVAKSSACLRLSFMFVGQKENFRDFISQNQYDGKTEGSLSQPLDERKLGISNRY